MSHASWTYHLSLAHNVEFIVYDKTFLLHMSMIYFMKTSARGINFDDSLPSFVGPTYDWLIYVYGEVDVY